MKKEEHWREGHKDDVDKRFEKEAKRKWKWQEREESQKKTEEKAEESRMKK